MQMISLKDSTPNIPQGAVWVLGFFDGVHLGHRKLFTEAARAAKRLGGENSPLPIAVWSFSSLPKANVLLTTREETAHLLEECGVDYFVLADFATLSSMDGKTFFTEQLQIPFAPAVLICGFNFRFGCGGRWTAEDLATMGEHAGIPVQIVDAYTKSDGETVSSTRIRALIQAGDLEKANDLLGKPYQITAPVQHGKKLGRTLGFPTINQRMPAGKVLPAHGIYICQVSVPDGNGTLQNFPGVCNVGYRPTVNDDTLDVTLETYILHFHGELYGQNVQVSFYKKWRNEQKFDDIEALSRQISQDASAAEAYFQTTKEERNVVEPSTL